MPAHPTALELTPEWLRLVQQKVEGLRYGVVQLVVHDGRVTQIERTEKTRLSAHPDSRDSSGL
ncbi:MAG TPA: YezD family protein [Candidatus Didemnitutus sp.]|nr:YezD family protein [Candidatus Didemnitutus sp.]